MAASVSEYLPDHLGAIDGARYQYDDAYEIARGIEIIEDLPSANDAVTLPYLYKPRDYQIPIWRAFFPQDPLVEAIKRAVLVWHRRAGKDKTCVNLVVSKMVERVGYYLYLLPKQTQARKVIWKGIGKETKDPDTGEITPGVKFLDHFPPELIKAVNNTEMTVEFWNGSICQLGGSDNFDAMMGTNPIGIVFSEYSLQSPLAWDYFRPILAENGGWAIFEYTPRGKNHGYFMHKRGQKLSNKKNSNWFHQLLTVEKTKAIPLEAIEEERGSGMSDEMIEQEFYCSFDAFNQGAVYGKQIKLAWEEERIGFFPAVPGVKVFTFWDIGLSKNNANAIWFAQLVDNQVRIVNCYVIEDEGLPHLMSYLEEWKQKHDVSYGKHWAPHDIDVREWTSKKKRIDIAREKGINFSVVPNIPFDDGIEATRIFLKRCVFNEEACEDGVSALTEYHYKYDDERKRYGDKPYHDWSSNAADALRMMAVAWRDQDFDQNNMQRFDRAVTIDTSFDPFEA